MRMGVPVECQTGRESDIPKNVTLELTRKCPLNCLMCSSNGGLPHPREFSLPKWMEIIDELMDLGAESFFLSGGEPFSYSYFKDICNYISKLDVSLSIYSSGNCIKNGELLPLSQNDIKFLSSLNLKNIIFSLEGSNEITHDKITTVNGSFQNTLISIKQALNQKVITELHFVPMLINYKELPMVVALAKKLGISRVSVLRYVDQGRGKKNSSHLKLGNEEIKQLRAILSEIDTSYVRLGHPLNPYLISNNSKCTAGRDRITVRYDGLVFPCEAMKFLADRYHDNDVNVRPIEGIWKNSAIFNLARNFSLDLPSECLNCNSLAKCGGGCPAQRLNEGSIGHLDAFCLHNFPDNLLKIV